MKTIQHEWQGAEWLERNLECQRKINAASRSKKKPKVAEKLSPLGRAVADLLGFVFRGIYHCDTRALMRVDWENTWYIEIPMQRGHELATYDGGELMWLITAANDLALRVAVRSQFGGGLLIGFSPRIHEGERADLNIYEKLPRLNEHIAKIRTYYRLVDQPGELHSTEPPDTVAPSEPQEAAT